MTFTYKTSSWESLQEFYRDLNPNKDMRPMLDLVNAIASSEYANGLHAFTSHAILNIGQHQEIEDRHALLSIEPILGARKLVFKYKGDNAFQPTWEKEVEANKAFEELVHFLKELKWVVY